MEDSEESRVKVFQYQQLEDFYRKDSSSLLGGDCGKEAGCRREEFRAGGLARAVSGPDDSLNGRHGLRCERLPFIFIPNRIIIMT